MPSRIQGLSSCAFEERQKGSAADSQRCPDCVKGARLPVTVNDGAGRRFPPPACSMRHARLFPFEKEYRPSIDAKSFGRRPFAPDTKPETLAFQFIDRKPRRCIRVLCLRQLKGLRFRQCIDSIRKGPAWFRWRFHDHPATCKSDRPLRFLDQFRGRRQDGNGPPDPFQGLRRLVLEIR